MQLITLEHERLSDGWEFPAGLFETFHLFGPTSPSSSFVTIVIMMMTYHDVECVMLISIALLYMEDCTNW